MPARLVPMAVGRTAVAVSGLAESGVVYRLTRGRLWIGALATLLVGIVAINVLALSFNATASRTGQQTDVLKRQVSTLRAQIAAAGASNERVQSEAAKLGLIVPEPGAIAYLSPSADDAAVAAKRLESGALTIGAPVATPAAPTATVASTPPPVPTTPTSTTPAQPAAAGQQATPTATTTATTTPTTSAGSTSTAVTAAPAQPASGGGTSSGGGVATP
jgi:hypothetical protein